MLEIDALERRLHIRRVESGSEYWEPYDQLMIATGARPICPDVPGSDAGGIFGVNGLQSAIEIQKELDYRKTFGPQGRRGTAGRPDCRLPQRRQAHRHNRHGTACRFHGGPAAGSGPELRAAFFTGLGSGSDRSASVDQEDMTELAVVFNSYCKLDYGIQVLPYLSVATSGLK